MKSTPLLILTTFALFFSSISSSQSIERQLITNSFETPYGSLQFSLINTGESSWITRIPFPTSSLMKSVSLYLYSNVSWFYEDTTPGIEIPSHCSENELSQDFLYNSIQGKNCDLTVKLVGHDLTYNFIPVPGSDSSSFVSTAGGIGLGAEKSALALSIRPKSKEIFSLYLSENLQLPSHILFGGIDPNFVEEGPIVKVSAISSSNWTLALNSFLIEQVAPMPVPLQKEYIAILDTNTPFIGIPELEFNKIFFSGEFSFEDCEFESSNNGLLCNCSSIERISSFTFTLGGKQIKIPASELSEDLMTKCRWKFGCLTTSSEESRCHRINKAYEDVWVLGGPFLSYFYTSFSFEPNTQQAEITFNIAKKELDIREAFGKMIEEKRAKSKFNVMEQVFIAFGSFAGLVIIFCSFKVCGGLCVERKHRFYKDRHQELEEEEEDYDDI